MSDGIKRFFKEAGVLEKDGGFGLALDGRAYRTPAKAPFILPTRAMAEAVATEWNAAGEKIFPELMPFTIHAATAIDRVAPQRDAVIDELAAYAGTELMCYRADGPSELIERQSQGWDPVLAWARAEHGLHFNLAEGIVHVAQPDETLARAKALLSALSDFELAAMHTLISSSGSFTLGLAVQVGYLTAAEAFKLAFLDELYQTEVWGEDEEAAERRTGLIEGLENAAQFMSFCQ